MQALRVLVVIMGLMILAGLTLLGAMVASRVTHRPPAPMVPPAAAPQVFDAPPIDLPAGAHIAAMNIGSDRLVVDVALADGGHQLVVIDLDTGRRLGMIPLRTAP